MIPIGDSQEHPHVRVWGRRTGISITLSKGDRQRLEALVADRYTPQKHVWRARIVLLSVDGAGTNAIMAATGTSKTTVWRWRTRFLAEGVDGLLRDKTRPPGTAPVAAGRGGRDRGDDAGTAAARGDALDSEGDGRSGGPRRLDSAEDLESPRPRPASRAGIQALQ